MTIRTLSAIAAALTVGIACAQDEEQQETSSASAEGAAPAVAQKQPAAKPFTILPFCLTADGVAEVSIPGSQEWRSVEEGRFYPLGSTYRTRGANSKLVIAFGADNKAILEGDSTFSTRAQGLGEQSRTLVLGVGTLMLDLARNLPEGMFVVTAEAFSVKNLAGESKFVRKDMPDGAETVVRCVTGTLAVEGSHFAIPQMRAADEVCIRSTVDNLNTILYGTSGDYIVKLDRGIVTRNDVDEEGKVKQATDKAELDWHLSPKTRVRINRMVPSIGERMSVAVMTFDAAGGLKNNFAFCEGRAEVNTGELVVSAADGDETVAKKAAEAAEETTTTAPADDDAAEGEDSKNENKNDKEEE